MEVFLRKVDKRNDCWLWTGATNSYGYGMAFEDNKGRLAHRVSWELHRGPIPKSKESRGIFVSRTCEERLCVNPKHLFLTTMSQNIRADRDETRADRFWKYVEKTDSCWNWIGPVNQYGYGRLNFEKDSMGAHQFSWILKNGPLPRRKRENRFVCHHCDNRLCVNPKHLFLGSIRDNNADRVKKRRDARGESSGMSKLSEADIRKIRKARARGLSQQRIADKFGINQTNVSSILLGKTWRHVK